MALFSLAFACGAIFFLTRSILFRVYRDQSDRAAYNGLLGMICFFWSACFIKNGGWAFVAAIMVVIYAIIWWKWKWD